MKIIFATGNKDKLTEIRRIFENTGSEIVSMKEAGIRVDIDENGETFADNAVIKAKAVWGECVRAGLICPGDDTLVMADDSGLEVDYMGKEPGVHSARWMGEDTSYDIKNAEILRLLSDAKGPERSARYVDVIAAVDSEGNVFTEEGIMEGAIAMEPAGDGGFGYDPIFFLPELGVTASQMTMDDKNRISHRGKALAAMRERLAVR